MNLINDHPEYKEYFYKLEFNCFECNALQEIDKLDMIDKHIRHSRQQNWTVLSVKLRCISCKTINTVYVSIKD